MLEEAERHLASPQPYSSLVVWVMTSFGQTGSESCGFEAPALCLFALEPGELSSLRSSSRELVRALGGVGA